MLQPYQVADAFDPGHLSLILLPTERCNFRCTYCYEDHEAGRMSPRVVGAIKALLDRRAPTLRSLHISWFGGEPLLAKQTIREISGHAAALARRDAPLAYSANMTTNGYLLDAEYARELVDLGVTFFQISLDGPPAVHDRSRIKANGDGSFARIWDNLLAIRDTDLPLEIMLRVHYSPATFDLLDPLIEAINREFAADRRFRVYMKAISRLGGSNDDAIPLFDAESESVAKVQLEQQLLSTAQVFELVRDDEPYVCYASQPNALVIRSSGELAKCTVAFNDDRNSVGRLEDDGTLSIDQGKVRLWMRGFATLDAGDLACPYTTMPVRDALSDQEARRGRKALPVLRG